jgi:excisionase family DNA binding protein
VKLEDYWTVHSAAEATGLEYKTLLKRIERGQVKYEPLGRMKLIPREEVDRLKAERDGSVAA